MKVDQGELERWGERVGGAIAPPAVIALAGPLGAGKSVLARAIARGVGVRETMPSPTYNLVLRYETAARVGVAHLDLYRLESPEDLWELGWSDLDAVGDVVLIEWPERAAHLVPADHWRIELGVPAGEPTLREVEVRRVGSPAPLSALETVMARP